MRILFTVLIILTLNNCKGQENNKQTNKPKKEKIMKTFDIEMFNKNKKNGNVYSFVLNDSITVEQHEGDNDYWELIKQKSSLFETYNQYYKNGKLKLTVERFSNIYIKGIMKEYDKQGDLIEETDLDKPFTNTWEDVKKYLEKHDVKDFKKDIVSVQRFDNPDKTYWKLEFQGRYKDLKGQFLIELDGKTGEELLVKIFKGKGSKGEVGTIAIYDTIYQKKDK